jgi:hypothetical protein
MATNIEITAQLNKMLAEQNQLYLNQAKIQRGQLAVMQAMAEAMGEVDVSKFNDSMKNINDQINAADEALKKMGTSGQKAGNEASRAMSEARGNTESVANAIEDAAEKTQKFVTATAAYEGAVKGFQLSFNVLTSIVSVLGTAISRVGQFAMAVLRFPLNIWNFLFEKATSGGGGSGLREALEAIRKEFGDLERSSSKAIISMAKSMTGTLGATGLSVYRTFGNLAERLKYFTELAKALGPLLINVVQRGMIQSAEAIGAFQKGLGLSNEQMKTIARTALISGTTIDESLREMSNYAIQLGEAFGMNAMEISRDMAEMETDMKHFGGLTRKELGETAVYAKKLGLEVKALTGIMDQWDNLDSAAEAAARLNQQFGIQIDTMRMLKTENPADRLEYLRQQFEKTGRTFEGLDRRSQAYLATQAGLTQEEAALAFAQNNRGVSLDQIKKKAGEAEKKQLTQAEAMQKLAGSIERLVKSGGGGAKTLFGAFVEGFQQAIFRSREFRQIMRNIRQMLRSTRYAGREVGRAFIEMFPGVKNILGGLADLFSPTRWKATLRKVVDAFKDFFKDLQTNPEAGLKNLFDRLKKAFFDHFDASTGAGRKTIEGFKTFFTTILKAIVGGLKAFIPIVFSALTTVITTINGFLKGDIGIPIDTSGILGQMMEILSGLWETIKQAWPPLWEAIKELFSIAFNKVSEWYEQNKLMIWGFLFGPAILRSAFGGLAAGLASGITKAAVDGITRGFASSAVRTAGQQAVQTVVQTISASGGLTTVTTTTTSAAQAGAAAAGGVPGLLSSLPIFAALTLLIPVIALMMTAAIALLGGFTLAQVGVTVAAMAAGELLLLGMVGLAHVMGVVGAEISSTAFVGALVAGAGLVVMGSLVAGVAFLMKHIISEFNDVKIEDIDKAVKAMAAGEVLLLGASALMPAALIAGVLSLAAPLIILGFGALASIVGGISTGMKSIINDINTNVPNIDAGLEAKLTAFVNVVDALANFMGVFVDMILASSLTMILPLMLAATGPVGIVIGGLLALVASVNSPLDQIIEIMDRIGPLMSELIQTITANIGSLSPDRLGLLQAVGPIIEAVGTLIEAMQPPTGIALIGSVMPFTMAFTVSQYLKSVMGIFTGDNNIIQVISEFVRELGSIPSGQFNAEPVKAFGAVLEGVAGILAAVANIAEIGVIDSISNALQDVFLAASGPLGMLYLQTKTDPVTKKLDAIISGITGILSAVIGSGIFDTISTLISTSTANMRGLSADQVKGLGALGSIISSVLSFIGTLTQNLKVDSSVVEAIANGTSREGIAAAERVATSLPTNLASSLETIFTSMRTSIGPIFQAMSNATSGLTTIEVNRVAKGAETVVSVINGVVGLLTAIKEIGTVEVRRALSEGTEATEDTLRLFDPASITSLLGSLEQVITTFFNPESGGLIKSIVQSLLTSGIGNLPRGIGEKAKAVVDILGLITAINTPDFRTGLDSLMGRGGQSARGIASPRNINDMLRDTRTVIDAIVTELGGLVGSREFQANLSSFTKTLVERMQRIPETLSVVSTILGTVNSDSFNANGVTDKITGIANTIQELVGKVNDINSELLNLDPININTGLQRLGNVLGVNNGELTINNRNFSIEVTFNVSIDARDLENVLIDRARTGRNRFVVGSGGPATAGRGSGGGSGG